MLLLLNMTKDAFDVSLEAFPIFNASLQQDHCNTMLADTASTIKASFNSYCFILHIIYDNKASVTKERMPIITNYHRII